MLKDAKEGKFDVILCKSQSRFTRDMEIAEKYINGLFLIWGIRFISLVDNIDTQVKGNKKTRQINALINEWYCEDLSENIRCVFRRKMEEGQVLTSFAPYGYKKEVTDKKRLVKDSEAAENVREIYRLYLEGNGILKIAGIMTERGIETPSRYKMRNGEKYFNPNSDPNGRKNTGWAANTVRKILSDEVYTGKLIQGKYRKVNYKNKKVVPTEKSSWYIKENNHEAIISEECFKKVQEEIKKRRYKHENGKGKGERLPYTVICGACAIRYEKNFNGKCGGSHRGNDCPLHNMGIKEIKKAVSMKIEENRRKNADIIKRVYEDMAAGKICRETADKIIERCEREIARNNVKNVVEVVINTGEIKVVYKDEM